MTPNPETRCPECSGAGFFGGNGPVVDSYCGFCKGTGVLVEEAPYRFVEPAIPRKPIARGWRCHRCRWINTGLYSVCQRCFTRKVA